MSWPENKDSSESKTQEQAETQSSYSVYNQPEVTAKHVPKGTLNIKHRELREIQGFPSLHHPVASSLILWGHRDPVPQVRQRKEMGRD